MPGGDVERVSRAAHSRAHGQHSGRWSRSFRAERAMRAGTLISVRRIVWVTARPSFSAGSAITAAARVRLWAMTASTSQAAFAAYFPDGRCASADALRSALTCSMIA